MKKQVIDEFEGKYSFLSNFYRCRIHYLGHICSTSEHAFQLAKATTYDDQIKIVAARTPSIAKRLGKRIKLRPDWEEIKLKVMTEVQILKYIQNYDLMKKLKATGDAELIEGNTWGDTYWGVDLRDGVGENHLGNILMNVRDCFSLCKTVLQLEMKDIRNES